MLKVAFIRHAKSLWSIKNLNDIDRPLAKRGYRDAFAMSEFLKRKGVEPEIIYSSTAIRAIQTARIMYERKKIFYEPDLYFNGIQSIIKTVNKTNDSIKFIAIVCHNPDLNHLLINKLKLNTVNITTSAIVVTSSNAKLWAEWNVGNAVIENYYYPKKNI